MQFRSACPPIAVVNTVRTSEPTSEVVRGVAPLETTLPDPGNMSRNANFSDKILSFFGAGQYASRARNSLVSMLWNLAWGIAQVKSFF